MSWTWGVSCASGGASQVYNGASPFAMSLMLATSNST